jgi:hypothetical protein
MIDDTDKWVLIHGSSLDSVGRTGLPQIVPPVAARVPSYTRVVYIVKQNLY